MENRAQRGLETGVCVQVCLEAGVCVRVCLETGGRRQLVKKMVTRIWVSS